MGDIRKYEADARDAFGRGTGAGLCEAADVLRERAHRIAHEPNKVGELKQKLTDHHHAVAAYAVDRAMQYNPNSGSRTALEQFAVAILDGNHIKAFEHGELDDLMAWAQQASPEERAIRRGIAPPKRDSSGGHDVPEPEVDCPCCENNDPCEVGPSGGRVCICCMETGKVPASNAAEMKASRVALLASKVRR